MSFGSFFGFAGLFVRPRGSRALAIREKRHGKDSTRVASSLSRIAWLHLSRRDYPRAEALFKEVLAVYRARGAPYRQAVAAYHEQLAHLYTQAGKPDLASGAYERAEKHYLAVLAAAESAKPSIEALVEVQRTKHDK